MLIDRSINLLLLSIVENVIKKEYSNFLLSSHGIDEDKFFIDFSIDENLSISEFGKIEKLINKIIAGAHTININKVNYHDVKNEYSSDFLEYLEINKDNLYEISFNNYKTIIDSKISFNKTNIIKAIKLFSIGGIQKNDKQLIHLTGVGFSNKDEFDEYLKEYQERLDSDHRKIGKDLDLFTFDLLSGQGLPIWLPKGAIIKKEIRNFLTELEFKYDFENVYTPILGDVELYKKSGHWFHYRENMFPLMKIDNEELVLRPMTCPHHVLVFKKKQYSYKQLPIRLCEESMLHRYESSGGLTGLERVREMVLEDTHIFCTQNQIEQEVLNCYNIICDAHKGFNSSIYQIDLSLHDPNNLEKFHNDPKMWNNAEDSLRKMLKRHNIPFVEKVGEAAFYGPKIDFQVKTSLNRIITMSTIQLDFLLPNKFELEYKDKDGEYKRPIMIHLGIIGTYERLVSIILEQTKGILPLWLAPIQVVIIPVNNTIHLDYANEIYHMIKQNLIRCKLDNREERMNKKIREAQTSKIPYQVIIGDEETKEKTISVRRYGSDDTTNYKLDDFIELISKEINSKK